MQRRVDTRLPQYPPPRQRERQEQCACERDQRTSARQRDDGLDDDGIRGSETRADEPRNDERDDRPDRRVREEIVAQEEVEAPKVVDLMEALRRSLDQVSGGKKKTAKADAQATKKVTNIKSAAKKRKAS